MRSKSTVGVVALVLAVAVLGAGNAFAQTPAGPATTVGGQADDQSGLDSKDGEDKSKPEKSGGGALKPETPNPGAPKADQPDAEAPKAVKPEAEKPKPDEPKPEKLKVDKPQAPEGNKPDAGAPKADEPDKLRDDQPEKSKPAEPRPTTESQDPAQPRPTTESPDPAQPRPTTESPDSAQPRRVQTDATRAQPKEPGPEPPVDVVNPVSPLPKAAPFVAGSDVRHVSTARSPAADRNGTAARSPSGVAGREWTSSARSVGDSADAVSVASGPAAVAPGRAARRASVRVDAGAAASLAPQQPRRLALGGPPPDNALIPVLFAILYAAGVAFVIRREALRARGLGTRRPAPPYRGARPWPAANGRERVDLQLSGTPLRTAPNRLPTRRSAPATLLLLEARQRSPGDNPFRATEHSRRR